MTSEIGLNAQGKILSQTALIRCSIFEVHQVEGKRKDLLFLFIKLISIVFLLSSCASRPLVKGVDFDSDIFIATLKQILEEDAFFKTRERCFFVENTSGLVNISDSFELTELETRLLENKLYNRSDRCKNFNRKDAMNYVYLDRIFVDSADFLLGVEIKPRTVTHREFYSGMVKDTEYRKIRGKMLEYCKINICTEKDLDTLNFVYISFAKCRSPVYTVFGIKDQILDVSQNRWTPCSHWDPAPPPREPEKTK